MSKRERLTYAAQALSAWWFEHRNHPLASRVLAKHDHIIGAIESWYEGQREWWAER